ncbi:hypothetical protein PVAP13_4KG211210 [Panicum virgatum]|uniref:Uncharacterized protein n=1 Tax=Panicum virgatum TaxID=38727 RepID=A0A8T0TNN7_PANVG|nr:hypothetical protein PVAP13_4KG211210 [Panicum virgatum]
MPHFDHLAFAFTEPPATAPAHVVRRTLQTHGVNPRVRLAPSSRGSQLLIFGDVHDRENTMMRAPLPFLDHTIMLERHNEINNRFLFQHEICAALSIEDYPLEHWNRDHIIHCVAPFANPHYIDPICLSGMDYSAVITVVKAEQLADIPHHVNFKNHDSFGSVGRVYVVHVKDIDGPDSDSDPDSDGDSDGELDGGESVSLNADSPNPSPPPASHNSLTPPNNTTPSFLQQRPSGAPSVQAAPLLHRPTAVQVLLTPG